MPFIPAQNPLKEDNVYIFSDTNGFDFRATAGEDMLLEVCGEFGDATVKPVWIDMVGEAQYFKDDGTVIETTSADYWLLEQPISRMVGVEVSGSSEATSLICSISKSES